MAMAKKVNFGKVSIVVFLTALIWVWADLSQDEELTLTNVVVEVAKSSDPALWVSFAVGEEEVSLQSSVTLTTVILKGPASYVSKIERLNNKRGLDLGLFLVPEQQGMTQEGVRTLDVLDFLRRSAKIRDLGLTVESCEPQTLTVRVRELARTSVPVECLGIDSSVRATLDPPTVEAYVPQGEAVSATIWLTTEERNQARNAAVEKTPYVELAPGQRRDVSTRVKISLAPADDVLDEQRVAATLGFCFSPNLQGKYRVKLENDPTEWASVYIKATPLAYRTYADAPYQLILYIRDQDRLVKEADLPIRRQLVYDFPEEPLRKEEIRAVQPAPTVRFTLEPIVEATVDSGP